MHSMLNRTPILGRDDYKAYLWLAVLALLGVFAKSADFSILHYVLNFGIACLVLFLGTIASRRIDAENRLRDPIALFAFMSVFAILLFPMRSPETSIGSVVLAFLGLYLAAVIVLMLWKKFAGPHRAKS